MPFSFVKIGSACVTGFEHLMHAFRVASRVINLAIAFDNVVNISPEWTKGTINEASNFDY